MGFGRSVPRIGGARCRGAAHGTASAGGASSVAAAETMCAGHPPLLTKAPQILFFCCKKWCNCMLKKRVVLRPA